MTKAANSKQLARAAQRFDHFLLRNSVIVSDFDIRYSSF